MVLEPAGGLPGAQVPETEVLVPGAGEGKVSIRGEDNVGDEMAEKLHLLKCETSQKLVGHESRRKYYQ